MELTLSIQYLLSAVSEINKKYEEIARITGENLLKDATYILIPNDDSYCYLSPLQRPSRVEQVKKIY